VSVLQERFLAQIACGNVFTHHNRELSTGICKSLGVGDAFQAFDGNWAAGANAILKSLLLNDAVCVPCHGGASPVRKNVRAGLIA
jgi:hypothetical protein